MTAHAVIFVVTRADDKKTYDLYKKEKASSSYNYITTSSIVVIIMAKWVSVQIFRTPRVSKVYSVKETEQPSGCSPRHSLNATGGTVQLFGSNKEQERRLPSFLF